MALNITRGAIPKAKKIVVYGPEGIGKTTFASQFPDPLFIDTEGSTKEYDVARVPAPASWQMLLDQVREVKVERPCLTLVIDTADWAERLCITHVCKDHGWKSIETPGYGQGYTHVVEEFGKLLNLLSDVVDAGMNVVLTAHAGIRKFDQPDEAASYNRWSLALIDAPKMSNAAKVKEWADAVLFVNYKTIVETVGDGKSAKGKARGGKRVMYCQHHPCWDAKNRWGLPEEVPFDYAQIAPFVPMMAKPAQMQQVPTQTQPAQTQAAVSQPMQQPQVQQPIQPIQTPQPAPIPTPTPVQTIIYGQDGTVVSNTRQPSSTPKKPALADFWAPALQLMEQNGVTLDEIKAVSVHKGFYTEDTPVENYPQNYVEGAIIAQWDKTLANVISLRNQEDVPFGAPDMTKI